MAEIILIGAGGHMRSCADVIELSGQFNIAGLVEKNESNEEENFKYPIIGTDDDLPKLRKEFEYALITIGQIKSVVTRVRLFDVLNSLGYKLPVIISPRSYVSHSSKIGAGTIILHDVVVNANAEIGKNCIINNKALVEHDAVVKDHCHLATGAIINGGVSVGKNSFIGSGVVTKQYLTIGSECIIGMGSVIKSDISSNQVVGN